MTITPINVSVFCCAQAGALAGMAITGVIVDPNSDNYSDVTAVAATFAQAFDLAWNDNSALDILQQQTITTVCHQQFQQHSPGSFSDPFFQQVSNWTTTATACVALVQEAEAFDNSQGIIPPSPGGGSSSVNQTNLLQYTVANPFVQSAAFENVTVDLSPIDSSSPTDLAAGQSFYIVNGGRYLVVSTSSNNVTLLNTGDEFNAAEGATVPADGNCSAVNMQPFGGNNVLVNPLGIDYADWARIVALWSDAALVGKIISLQAGTFLYNNGSVVNTDLSFVDHARVQFSPETKILGFGSSDGTPYFEINESGPTWDLILVGTFATAPQGATSIQFTSTASPLPAPGDWMWVASPENPVTANTWAYQRRVISITPVSGSLYTIVLDRGLPRTYGNVSNPGQIYIQYLSSEGIDVDCNFATMSAVLRICGILNARNMTFGNLNVDGALGLPNVDGTYLFTFFQGVYRLDLHDINIDLSGATNDASGIALYSTEKSIIQGITIIGAATAFELLDCVTTGLVNCEGSNGTDGVVLGSNDGNSSIDGTDGCISCYIRDCTFNNNSQFGINDVADNSVGIVNLDSVYDNITANFNDAAGINLTSPNSKLTNSSCDYNNYGLVINSTSIGSAIANVSFTGNTTEAIQSLAEGVQCEKIYIERTVNNQLGIQVAAGSMYIEGFTSYDNFTGNDGNYVIYLNGTGRIKIRGGTIFSASVTNTLALIMQGSSSVSTLDVADMDITAGWLLLMFTNGLTARLTRINFTATAGQGVRLSDKSTLWLNETPLPSTNSFTGLCFISQPIQQNPGVWTNRVTLVAGSSAVPWPQVGENSVSLTLVANGGSPGNLSVISPVSGELSVTTSTTYALTGTSLTVTPSTGGGSAATVNFVASQTPAQVATALNAAFASAGTDAIASVSEIVPSSNPYVYIAPTVIGVTLAVTGTAQAVLGFAGTIGFVVKSSSNTDTSTVSFVIND